MRPENHDFRKIIAKQIENTQEHSSLLYESPGRSQVDGLPPVANEGFTSDVKSFSVRDGCHEVSGIV